MVDWAYWESTNLIYEVPSDEYCHYDRSCCISFSLNGANAHCNQTNVWIVLIYVHEPVLQRLFGLTSLSIGYMTQKSVSDITTIAVKQLSSYDKNKTFKVETRRRDKTFSMKSPLIGYDKHEIITKAKHIETYDIVVFQYNLMMIAVLYLFQKTPSPEEK